eukprot:8110689-Ditylum_brightwellii.AAC.1
MMERDERLLHQMKMMTDEIGIASSSDPNNLMALDCNHKTLRSNGQTMPTHSFDTRQRYFGGVDCEIDKRAIALVHNPSNKFCDSNPSSLGGYGAGTMRKQEGQVTHDEGMVPFAYIDN